MFTWLFTDNSKQCGQQACSSIWNVYFCWSYIIVYTIQQSAFNIIQDDTALFTKSASMIIKDETVLQSIYFEINVIIKAHLGLLVWQIIAK